MSRQYATAYSFATPREPVTICAVTLNGAPLIREGERVETRTPRAAQLRIYEIAQSENRDPACFGVVAVELGGEA